MIKQLILLTNKTITMKKLFILPFILFSLLACNENVDFENPAETTSYAFVDSFYVPFETALTYAEQMLNKENGSTRTSTKRKVAEHYEYITNNATRSTGENIDVRFHVINFENNQGFALVSADSRTTPVYAYSSTGNLNIDESIENSGFGDFMDAATEHYAMEIDFTGDLLPVTPTPITPVPTNPIQQLPMVELDGEKYYVYSVDATISNPGGILVNATWGQGWPYNYYCGENTNATVDEGFRNVAGCGPIAAAMIMSYHKHPASHNGYTFDWNAITSMSCFPFTFPYIDNNAKAAARLINQVGIEADADYGLTTPTTITKIYRMFKDFGYSCTGPVDFNPNNIRTSLNNDLPIFLSGKNSQDKGHGWVVDSYEQNIITNTYYYSYEPFEKYMTKTLQISMYYHCNWGWEGTNNGWFLNVFEGLNINNKMIYDIQPNN